MSALTDAPLSSSEFNGLMALLHVRIYSKIRGYHLPLMCILSVRLRRDYTRL